MNKATPAITWATPAANTLRNGVERYPTERRLNCGRGLHLLTRSWHRARGGTTDPHGNIHADRYHRLHHCDNHHATLTVNQGDADDYLAHVRGDRLRGGTSAAQLDATAPTPGVFTYTPAAGTILPPGHQALSVSFVPADTADYRPATGANSVLVNPAPLTVTAANASRPYGAANPVFSATVAGAVNNDSFTASAASLATSASAVGSYAIVPSVSGANLANYIVSPINGTLTVTPAPLAVVPSNATRTYGSANPTLTGSVTGALNGDTFTVTGSTTAMGTSAVGSYPITYVVTGANLADYAVVPAPGR